jgi:hypothetical protein
VVITIGLAFVADVTVPPNAPVAECLGGHLKTGHRWTLQNRPTEQKQDKIFIPCRRSLRQIPF